MDFGCLPLRARAAAGIFFGEDSAYNKNVLLTEGLATNQVAELRSGILALYQVLEVREMELWKESLRQVVIKADSECLVKGMTEWVFKWEKNSYRTSKNAEVINASLFKELHRLVERLNLLGVEVLFWHVPRNQNWEADSLANQAFMGE